MCPARHFSQFELDTKKEAFYAQKGKTKHKNNSIQYKINKYMPLNVCCSEGVKEEEEEEETIGVVNGKAIIVRKCMKGCWEEKMDQP